MVAQPLLFEGFGAAEPPDEFGQMTVRELKHSQILTKGTGSLAGVDFSLNPYVGCGFNCSYCFATFFQADEEKRSSWGSWVDVKVNAARDILKRMDLRGKSIFMSSATDPYQPLEAKVGLTRAILEVLVEKQPELIVQTRGPLVVRDIDLLSRLEKVRVQMSITTDCDEIRKEFEPSCASIERRLEALTKVKEAGIPTTVSIAPMLPVLSPRGFAEKIIATGADKAWAGSFILSDREFAASTRQRALDIAARHGWDKGAVERTKAEMRRWLPELR